MTRSLLNSVPMWVLTLAGVGGAGALAALGLVLVRTRVANLTRLDVNDVAGIAIGVLAAVYAIILGFVVVTLYEDFTEAQENVQAESGHVSQLYDDTRGMAIAGAMRCGLHEYVAAVRTREFTAMRAGRDFAPRGSASVGMLYRTLQGYTPPTENRVAFYEDAVRRLNDIVASRVQRRHDASESLPAPFAYLLVIGAFLMVGSLYLLHVPRLRVHVALVVSVAVVMSFSLLIAAALDYPFSGDISVSSEPFTQGRLAILAARPSDCG